MGSIVLASTVGHHVIADLGKASEQDLESFAHDLSSTLNVLKACPQKTQDEIRFGNRLVSVSYSDDKTGGRNYELKATGSNPPPSFANYEITISVESTVVKRKGPAPEDAPKLRKYRCKVKKTYLEEK